MSQTPKATKKIRKQWELTDLPEIEDVEPPPRDSEDHRRSEDNKRHGHRHWKENNDIGIREKIFLTLEEPRFSPLAFVVAVIIFALVVSAVTLIILSLPQNFNDPPPAVWWINFAVVILFTIEYLLRLFTAQRWWRWIIQPYNIIDLLAILPKYIELGLEHRSDVIGIVRIVRLMRIFRLLKILRYSVFLKKRVKVGSSFKLKNDITSERLQEVGNETLL